MSNVKTRLEGLVRAWGPVALGTWLSLFVLTLLGFGLAISLGVEAFADDAGAASTLGVWGGAYLATQATKPLRLLATLALTPLVARVLGRTPAEDPEASPGEAQDAAPSGGEPS
ncbi:MAG: hypothetical protein AAFZ18_01675 [Myxococcota bacterium]